MDDSGFFGTNHRRQGLHSPAFVNDMDMATEDQCAGTAGPIAGPLPSAGLTPIWRR